MDDHDERETRGYRVYGRVQGVGFRWWTRGVAEELDLAGSVRNIADGSVEVRASGAPTSLDRLEERLRRGPTAARVDRVEAVEIGAPEVVGAFRIEP